MARIEKRSALVVASTALMFASASHSVAQTATDTQAASSTAPAEAAISAHFDDQSIAWGACPDALPAGCALAVLHGDPAKPGADILLKLPAHSTIANHTHTSAERIVLLAGELRATYEGQSPTVLKAGGYAFGPAGKPHTADCVSDEPCVLFIAFNEPVDVKLVEPPK